MFLLKFLFWNEPGIKVSCYAKTPLFCYMAKRDTKDRFRATGALITAGFIKSFAEIWKHIPRSNVYRKMGMNYNRFSRLVKNPALFTLKELEHMSRLFEIDPEQLIRMAWQQYIAGKPKRKK